MSEEVQKIENLGLHLAHVYVAAWHDYIEKTDVTLEVKATYNRAGVCVEVVDWEDGEVVGHCHFE